MFETKIQPEEWAITLAVQIWCRPECSMIEMDSRLAYAFADVLMQQRDAYNQSTEMNTGV